MPLVLWHSCETHTSIGARGVIFLADAEFLTDEALGFVEPFLFARLARVAPASGRLPLLCCDPSESTSLALTFFLLVAWPADAARPRQIRVGEIRGDPEQVWDVDPLTLELIDLLEGLLVQFRTGI